MAHTMPGTTTTTKAQTKIHYNPNTHHSITHTNAQCERSLHLRLIDMTSHSRQWKIPMGNQNKRLSGIAYGAQHQHENCSQIEKKYSLPERERFAVMEEGN